MAEIEVKEPTASYYTRPNMQYMRQVILHGIEQEENIAQLEQLYAHYNPSGKTFEEEVAEARALAEQYFEPEDVEELAKADFTVGHDPKEWNWYPPTTDEEWERQIAEWEEESKTDEGISFDEFKRRYSKLL